MEKTLHSSYQGTCLLKIFGKIHILKASDYPEFKTGFCSVAKRQIHPRKCGFCGKRHITWWLLEFIWKVDKRGHKTGPVKFHSWRFPCLYLKNSNVSCQIPTGSGGGGFGGEGRLQSFKHNLFPVFIPRSQSYVPLNISRRLSKRKHPEVYIGHTIE